MNAVIEILLPLTSLFTENGFVILMLIGRPALFCKQIHILFKIKNLKSKSLFTAFIIICWLQNIITLCYTWDVYKHFPFHNNPFVI